MNKKDAPKEADKPVEDLKMIEVYFAGKKVFVPLEGTVAKTLEKFRKKMLKGDK